MRTDISKPPEPPIDVTTCIYIEEGDQVCLMDVAKLFESGETMGHPCALKKINEAFAFAQSFEITILTVVLVVIFAKICAIQYDNKTLNKLVFWQHVSFLLWVLAHLTVISTQFFVNPQTQYNNYIEPLKPPGNDPRQSYMESAQFWV